jgi:hypothetical protein
MSVGFSDVDSLAPMPVVAGGEYYNRSEISEELEVPDLLGLLFDRFYGLGQDLKMPFLNAAHWFGQAAI